MSPRRFLALDVGCSVGAGLVAWGLGLGYVGAITAAFAVSLVFVGWAQIRLHRAVKRLAEILDQHDPEAP